jgi:hypothetical protein
MNFNNKTSLYFLNYYYLRNISRDKYIFISYLKKQFSPAEEHYLSLSLSFAQSMAVVIIIL